MLINEQEYPTKRRTKGVKELKNDTTGKSLIVY